MKNFMDKFVFRQERGLFLGIERECFLVDLKGNIVPIAANVLKELPEDKRFGYELSACQLEDRIGPCELEDVKKNLLENEAEIKKAEFRLVACRVIGTHIHVGMPDHDTAMKVYNEVALQWEYLCQLGDGSNG